MTSYNEYTGSDIGMDFDIFLCINVPFRFFYKLYNTNLIKFGISWLAGCNKLDKKKHVYYNGY